MAERITSGRVGAGKPSSFNWLKWLDQEVRQFPSTADWSQHPPFQFARCRLLMMARYPQLQRPFPDEVLYRELSRGENQILGHPETRHVLDGLNDRQRKELSALFLDTFGCLESYRAHRRRANRVQKLAGEAPSRTRVLTRKLGKARRALEDLREYAETLDELLGSEHVRATKTCLETLQKLKEDTTAAEFYQSIESEYPALEGPVMLSMVQLYWFFRSGCGLSGHESEVRVAMIRNAHWTSFGVAKVDFIPAYQKQTTRSRGCQAVHEAVRRFLPNKAQQAEKSPESF
ncbi:MAG: hypothetical protein WBR26_06855 [Candidatus Acidiferrum sp.]